MGYEMKYINEAREIWQKYVPEKGQSETVQGELLRAIEKLRDEAIRNGNVNWDEGFEILCDYILTHLYIDRTLGFLNRRRVKQLLGLISKPLSPCFEEETYDELTDLLIIWNKKKDQIIRHENNPKLYR